MVLSNVFKTWSVIELKKLSITDSRFNGQTKDWTAVNQWCHKFIIIKIKIFNIYIFLIFY